MRTERLFPLALLGARLWTSVQAQVIYTGPASANTFVATGSANNPAGTNLTCYNYGGSGILAVAPGSSLKGEFQALLRFNFSNTVAQFNAAYGSNNWLISRVSLQLACNEGMSGVQPPNQIFNVVNGGAFVIEWLSDNSWVQGSGTPNAPTSNEVTYASLPLLLASPHVALCTNTYVPPGNNVPVIWALPADTNLLGGIAGGGDVSLRLYAADNQVNYLFNSDIFSAGNQPTIQVTAVPVQLRIVSAMFVSGRFQFAGIGRPGSAYGVQAASDLGDTNWQALGTVDSDNTGAIHFNDSQAGNFMQRFYRLVGAP